MNGIFLALSVIVIGYIYQNRNLVTKYSISEIPAHHLYYKSAITGFIFFFIGFLISFFALWQFSLIEYRHEANFLQNLDRLPDVKVLWVFSFITALLLCISFVRLKNFILLRGIDRVNNINKIYAMTLTTPLDRLLNDSAFLAEDEFQNKIVMLSMDNRKVYVGTVFPDRKIFERFLYGQTEFIFCPMYSGYRHKDTADLVITTDYFNHKQPDQHQYQVILNRKNIVSATKVDLDTLFDFMDKDDFLNKLNNVYLKKLPIMAIMKNKNIYIGRLVDNISAYATLSDVRHLGLNLAYHCVFEREQLKLKQYYDFVQYQDLYCSLSFRDIESIWFRNKPEKIWIQGQHISAELLLKLFDHKLVDSTDFPTDLGNS